MRLLPTIAFGLGLIAAPALAGEHVLHSFDANYPYGDLVLARSGTIYGALSQGGAHDMGLLYSLDSGGNFTVLHDFAGKGDGAFPNGGLIADGTAISTASPHRAAGRSTTARCSSAPPTAR